MELLEQINNIELFVAHYNIVIPKLEKNKVNKRKKQPIKSPPTPKKERILKTVDMKQYKRDWYIENKNTIKERSKLWRSNNPQRDHEIMRTLLSGKATLI